MPLWILVLFNLLISFVLVRKLTAGAAPSKDDYLQPGESAPAFSAQTLQGDTVTLSTYSGRNVAFLFISPTCKPCQEALPTYLSLAPKAARAGVELVFVSTAPAELTRAFINEHNVNLPVLIATREENSFMKDYKAYGTPSYAIIDGGGKIQSAGFPSMVSGEWKAWVSAWETGASMTPKPSLVLDARG